MRLRLFMLLLFFSINPVFAYIDPGTGSILVSVIIGLLMAALFSLRGVFYWFLSLFSGKISRNVNDFSGKLVFYSEGGRYWPVFVGVLKNLRDRGIRYIYLSSDKDDEGLGIKCDFHESRYIGNMHASIAFLNSLKADVCVMTTPQLNVINLKRSQGVNHYCHLMHAPADIHTYKKFAFDHFDSVLCTGEFQIQNIRQLENERCGKEKLLFRTGCTLFDDIENQTIPGNNMDTVLVAPTWGDKSSLLPHSEKLIGTLIESRKKVIFRPHPQSLLSDRSIVGRIIRRYETNELFEFDGRHDNQWAIINSRALICDISGVVFDFVFINRIAAVIFDSHAHIAGYEAFDLPTPNALYSFIRETGCALITDDKDKALNEVVRLMGKPVDDVSIQNYIFNYGSASSVAAEQIISLLR